MKMRNPILLLAVLALAIMPADQALAQADIPDCGDAPTEVPAVPDGKREGREAMLVGVSAVKVYSEAIDAWLACKDRRAVTVFQWMNEEQRARWEEDLASIHDRRVEIQRQMNEQIRIFNARTGSN